MGTVFHPMEGIGHFGNPVVANVWFPRNMANMIEADNP
jgi:hypothetical protein